jgi:hypothetical protein
MESREFSHTRLWPMYLIWRGLVDAPAESFFDTEMPPGMFQPAVAEPVLEELPCS